MKNVTLIKCHPVIQLGHLYEHLFLRCINNFFYEHGLFKMLDYAAYGVTYEEGGIITAVVELYSDEAIKLSGRIDQLHINFDDEGYDISTALFQVTAEEPDKLYISDLNKVVKELKQLDQDPWQHIDSIDVLDTKTIRRKNKPIYLTNQPEMKPKILRLSIHLDEDTAGTHRELSPLFMFIGRIILMTIGNRVGATYGTYAGELYGNKQYSLVSELLISQKALSGAQLAKVAQTIEETLTHSLNKKTYMRIIASLSSVSYVYAPDIAPNLERMITETGVLVGEKGWRRLATIQNIESLLSDSRIELKLGRQTIVLPLPPPAS